MSVKIDGIKLADIGVRVLAGSNIPIAPPTRDRLVVVPGRHGAYDFGSDFDVRTFELDCAIMRQASAIALQRKAREIAALFTDAYGRPKEVRLEFDDEPGKFYTVKLTGALPLERIARIGKFTLVLRAADPAAYTELTAYNNSAPLSYNAGLQYDTGLIYDNESTFQWTHTRHYFGLNNHSEFNTAMVVTIQGTVINPRIRNTETGEVIQMPTITNETLTLNSADFTVKKDNINVLNGVHGNFINILPGENSFVFEGGLPNATVKLTWKHKFI